MKRLLLFLFFIVLFLVFTIVLTIKQARSISLEKPIIQTSTFSNKIAFTRNADIWLSNFDGSKLEEFYETSLEGGAPTNLIWSPDAKYIAFLYEAYLPLNYPPSKWDNIYLLNVQNKELTQLTHANGYNNALGDVLSWSPDGKLLAALHFEIDKAKKTNSTAYWPEVWTVDGKLVWTLKGSELSKKFIYQNYHVIGWSRDNTSIYLRNSGENVTYKIKIDSSEKPRPITQKDYGDLVSNTISPDGKFSAYEQDGNIWMTNLENGEHVQLTTDGNPVGHGKTYDWIRWSPDSKYVSARFYSNFTAAGALPITDGISIITVDNKEKVDIPFGEHAMLFDYMWSSDSNRIIVNTDEEDIWVFNRKEKTSKKIINDAYWATVAR
ncbi:MAG TPA: DPP IV N-terminal domain-containing protein [Alphaproteobacteria bacterium]|jgi:Tol biopolymer transport system component|nr:DPP IV N-terminal domain-containing protein [Alphaproteobacteria bacterium]